MRVLALLTSALLATACAEANPPGDEAAAPQAKKETSKPAMAPEKVAKEAIKRVEAKAEANMSAPPHGLPKGAAGHGAAGQRPTHADIKYNPAIEWLEFEAAQAKAKAEKKRVMLLVYANWCPRCQELAPAFEDPELVALSRGLIMVKQEQDARPAWLAEFASHGSYVPRILFLEPDGTVNTEFTSGHPRYPLFYTPHGVAQLKASMGKAGKGT